MNLRLLYRFVLKCLASAVIAPEWHGEQAFLEFKNKILRRTGMKIGKEAGISAGFRCVLGHEELLDLGAYSGLAYGARILNFAPVKIGAFTTVAADVTLASGGPGVSPTSENPRKGISIGRGCWIGNGACLVGDISIGDHVVIGAGSVVTSDIPERAIAVGVPARVIRYRDLPEKVWFTPDLCLDTKTFQVLPHPKLT